MGILFSSHSLEIDGIEITDKSNLYPYMFVNAGNYSSEPYEFTADLIANLAVNGFHDDNGILRQYAWDWFVQNATNFITNMSCTIGDQGYACSGNYNVK